MTISTVRQVSIPAADDYVVRVIPRRDLGADEQGAQLIAIQGVVIAPDELYAGSPEQTVTGALADLYESGGGGGSGVDLENALASPTGFLGHDSDAGTVTPAVARTLLALVTSGAGAPTASADFVGQYYVNTTPDPDTVYQALGPSVGNGAADWTLLGDVTLAANQFAVQNSGNTALEARTDKRAYTVSLAVTADGTYQLPPWPDMPCTGVDVQSHTWAGTCSIKIQKAAGDINGYSSAVAQTTAVTTTASTETYTKGAKMQVVVSSASSLTGLAFTINATRTGA